MSSDADLLVERGSIVALRIGRKAPQVAPLPATVLMMPSGPILRMRAFAGRARTRCHRCRRRCRAGD